MEGERDPNSQDLYENNPLYYNSDDILLEIDNKDHGERGQI